MCRLFALISSRKIGPEFHALMRPFQQQAVEHPQGWGFGWYEDGKARLIKKPVSAYQNPEFLRTADEIESDIVIAHIRKASEGSKQTVENTHPFMYDQWVFAHNGTIDIAEEMKQRLPESYRARIKGQTDTEVYFQWVLFNIGEKKEVENGIKDAVHFIKARVGDNSSAMNFLLSDGRKLFVYRRAFKRVDHYTLHHLKRKDMVIVSSDPLTKEEWTSMTNGELIIIDKDLRIKSIPL